MWKLMYRNPRRNRGYFWNVERCGTGPGMWWDSRRLLNETKAALASKKFDGKSLFLGIANTMPPGMDTTQAVSDTSGNNGHIRAILALDKAISSRPGTGLKYTCKFYNDDDHSSVPLIAEYDALHFLYKGFGDKLKALQKK